MSTATLRCGTVLAYEAPSFLPAVGELVPCSRHDYCVVEGSSAADLRGRGSRRARPRGRNELLDWLRQRPRTTVHELRRQRFTLRLIAAAEREGLVSVDVWTGAVFLRPARDDASGSPPATGTG